MSCGGLGTAYAIRCFNKPAWSVFAQVRKSGKLAAPVRKRATRAQQRAHILPMLGPQEWNSICMNNPKRSPLPGGCGSFVVVGIPIYRWWENRIHRAFALGIHHGFTELSSGSSPAMRIAGLCRTARVALWGVRFSGGSGRRDRRETRRFGAVPPGPFLRSVSLAGPAIYCRRRYIRA